MFLALWKGLVASFRSGYFVLSRNNSLKVIAIGFHSSKINDDDELYVYVYKNHQRGQRSQTRTTPRGESTKELAKSDDDYGLLSKNKKHLNGEKYSSNSNVNPRLHGGRCVRFYGRKVRWWSQKKIWVEFMMLWWKRSKAYFLFHQTGITKDTSCRSACD